MGILPDHILRKLGPSMVEPFDQAMVQPSSLDLHIDRYFLRGRDDEYSTVDPSKDNENRFYPQEEIPQGRAFVLRPGQFALAATYEKVNIPNFLVARFEGKSSIGRLGLLTHITAGFIDPGFEGHITLELRNVTGMHWRIFPGMKIGQICFEELSSAVVNPYGSDIYGSHYQGQRGPTLSRSHQNFKIRDVYSDVKETTHDDSKEI